jgi:hypothetical protein
MKKALLKRPVGGLSMLLASTFVVAGCKPNLGAPASLVTGPAILAIRGTPPEAAESGAVVYDALAVDLDGTAAAP